MTTLHKNIVLVLNRNWQAINITTPALAFCQMSTDVATGLDIQGLDYMVPTKWQDWLKLPVRDEDHSIGTANGALRVPTVIVLANFSRVPVARPSLNARNLYARDGGRCQYTGQPLAPGEGNVDHVVPRSRGGDTSWENCVLASRKVNSKKADKTPAEAGLKLITQPKEPRHLPVTYYLNNSHGIDDWNIFLNHLSNKNS
ncbi:MAG: 5-methylcytosine-specific restriction endonuclease McrA [Verrucomicrobiales bacterium]|jgi:5-methylcytosine-specific restriction endonuclease McrA